MGRGSLGDSLSARWVEDAGSVADDVSVLLDRSLVEQSCTQSAQVSDVRPIHGHSCLCLVPRVGHGVCTGCALAVGCGLGDKQHGGEIARLEWVGQACAGMICMQTSRVAGRVQRCWRK